MLKWGKFHQAGRSDRSMDEVFDFLEILGTGNFFQEGTHIRVADLCLQRLHHASKDWEEVTLKRSSGT
jgi:hypothetical protein